MNMTTEQRLLCMRFEIFFFACSMQWCIKWYAWFNVNINMVYAWVVHDVCKHDNGLTASTSAQVACNRIVKAEKGSFVTKILVKRKSYLIG